MSLPELQTLVKHDKSSLPGPQTLVKHDKSSLPEPDSSIYSSNPIQIQLRSIRSPHGIQTEFKSIHAHFMPTQIRAICSHNLQRISRSPLIRSHDGSAAAAAAPKSAAPPAHGVLNPGSTSLRGASAKLNGRAAALAGPPTSTNFWSTFCLLNPQSADICNPQSSILNPGDPQSSIC